MSTDARFIQADTDGRFRRPASKFRGVFPSDEHPVEKDRYVLYVNYGCPWAHRANIVRSLKRLDDIIQLVEVDDIDPGPGKGWFFSGKFGPRQDPVTGAKFLRELYLGTDSDFTGRHFASEKGPAGLFAEHLRDEIVSMNSWVDDTVNNGVYKCGFATTQEAYDENIYPPFASLDRLENHLENGTYGGPYLFGNHITEADIRLFPALVRFDVGYYMLFKVNLKMVRHDYPHLHTWLQRLYWDTKLRLRTILPSTQPQLRPDNNIKLAADVEPSFGAFIQEALPTPFDSVAAVTWQLDANVLPRNLMIDIARSAPMDTDPLAAPNPSTDLFYARPPPPEAMNARQPLPASASASSASQKSSGWTLLSAWNLSGWKPKPPEEKGFSVVRPNRVSHFTLPPTTGATTLDIGENEPS
ncbi:Glutathione S-transferase [Fusarium albosuccineum]|uniref:Glutathione S-transferase n=1 Tax=Fusarium albosuccineum TaxID=1237068 RepID=A0A8H4P5Q2_9HYPO|nr:Glutathione S-transferase [Fusarium albosuccineum]